MTHGAKHILLMALFAVHPAWAQDAGVSTTEASSNQLDFQFTPSGIGIATCEAGNEAGLSQSISVTSTYTSDPLDTDEREVHLLLYTDEACLDELLSNPTDCALSAGWNASNTAVCGCIHRWSEALSNNSATFKIDEITGLTADEWQSAICSGTGKTVYLKHRVYIKDADGSLTEDEDSASIEVLVDLEPPTAPSTAPTVVPGDAKLRVTPNYEGETPAQYQICACPNVEGSNANACTTCEETATIPSGGFEFTRSITNETNYAVVFRVLDSVGNESDPSPSATGTPTELYDFAETYESWARGRGERGGCALASDEPSPLPWLVALVMIGGLTLRRRNR